MLAGEKEKMPEELLQLEGKLVDEAMVGLDGTTESGETSGNGVKAGEGGHRESVVVVVVWGWGGVR